MKIAQIANVWQSIPPPGYGGSEKVIYNLCEGLTKKGHQIYLFGTGDSKISGNLSFIFKEKLLSKGIDWSNFIYPLLHFTYTYEQIKKSGDYDIIHGHYSLASDLISLAMAHLQDLPSVFTLHSPLYDKPKYDDRNKIFEYCKKLFFISISNKQRTLPLNYLDTIYHGIYTKDIHFSETSTDNSLLWLGRIVPEKGLEYALTIAANLNKQITVVGRVDKENNKNYEYFKEKCSTKLAKSNITFMQEIDANQKNEVMLKSKCFLFPIIWEEPFGLVIIESMATGTPVVAFAQGSVPEIIKDGETGYIVNVSNDDIRGDWLIKKTGIEGFQEAVEKIYSLPNHKYQEMRKACREHVEKNFTVERMVDKYEKVYQQIIATNKK